MLNRAHVESSLTVSSVNNGMATLFPTSHQRPQGKQSEPVTETLAFERANGSGIFSP